MVWSPRFLFLSRDPNEAQQSLMLLFRSYATCTVKRARPRASRRVLHARQGKRCVCPRLCEAMSFFAQISLVVSVFL